jgi:hypothetical protein
MFWMLLMLLVVDRYLDRGSGWEMDYLYLTSGSWPFSLLHTISSPKTPFISQWATQCNGVRSEAIIESFRGSQKAPVVMFARMHSHTCYYTGALV